VLLCDLEVIFFYTVVNKVTPNKAQSPPQKSTFG